MVRTRRAAGIAALAAGAVLLTGCGGDSGGEETSSSTTASAEPTYDEAYIMGQVKKVDAALRARDLNEPIPEDAAWASDKYRTAYNADTAQTKKSGLVTKGRVTTTALHLDTSDPDAPGGWYVTVYACATSTVRGYIDGKDVTADPNDPGKLLPKGPRDVVQHAGYTTPDDGKTWQLDRMTTLTEQEAKDSPCG